MSGADAMAIISDVKDAVNAVNTFVKTATKAIAMEVASEIKEQVTNGYQQLVDGVTSGRLFSVPSFLQPAS